MRTILAAALIIISTPAVAQYYDYRSGNSYYRSGNSLYGYNGRTGSTWSQNYYGGKTRGYDSGGNYYTYDHRSGNYYNYGTGRTCYGKGAYRTCY